MGDPYLYEYLQQTNRLLGTIGMLREMRDKYQHEMEEDNISRVFCKEVIEDINNVLAYIESTANYNKKDSA